jgi:LysR family transcriptional activator of nhaA
MEWLNYHHLYYFWVVAREGSIAKATRVLHVTQPTISAQIRQLEESLGEKLLEKSGRGLAVTESGNIAFRYADEIFGLGRELRDTLRDRPTGRPVRATIGIADVVPKLVAYRILRPAFEAKVEVELTIREGRPDELIQQIAQHEIDLVVTDAPAPRTAVRAFSHAAGESGTSFFAAPALGLHRENFPQSLNGASLLLPATGTQLRRNLEYWLNEHEVTPRRVAEFDDLALMMEFGRNGRGVFPAPTMVERDIEAEFKTRVIGRLPALKERFYLVSGERKVKNPIVAAITNAAHGAAARRT